MSLSIGWLSSGPLLVVPVLLLLDPFSLPCGEVVLESLPEPDTEPLEPLDSPTEPYEEPLEPLEES